MAKKKESVEPTITKLSDKKEDVFLSFGINELDELTGGIPIGRITELWGNEGVGKTYTLGRIMAANSNLKILLIDAEFAINADRIKAAGGNLDNIDFLQDARLERVSELVLGAVGKYDLILLDSLSFLTPTTVDNAEVGENAIGLFSRLIKHFVIKLRPRLGVSKTAMVVVNQWRKPLGLYVKAEPSGGQAWLHAVDVRLKLSANSGDKITKGKEVVGMWSNVEVLKSKVSQPYLSTKFKIDFIGKVEEEL